MKKFARIVIAIFGVAFSGFVALQFKRPAPAQPSPGVVRADPKALIETTSGTVKHLKGSREDVDVTFQKASTYGDGSTRFTGLTIAAVDRNRPSRRFVITANEGQASDDDSVFTLDGNVRMESSDGMAARSEHAVYHKADGSVDAAGPIEFARGRFSGSGIGLRFDGAHDIVNIVNQAVIHVAADANGAGAAAITATSAFFARPEHQLRLDGNVRIERGRQIIEADAAVGFLSEDEKRVERIELHNHSRINTSGAAAPGSLRSVYGADMTLHYAGDGQSLQRVEVFNEAIVRMAGDPGKEGRQISARLLDVSMAPDGSTPTALSGRDNVEVLFPADGAPARQITAPTLDARGEPGRGLTRATFAGGVQFRERGGRVERAASSATLDVMMKPGMSAIEDARFAHRVRFEEGAMAATAASSRYDVVKGTLELSGSEPGFVKPHVDNEQIAIDAAHLDVTLEGPIVDAKGSVKSTILPPRKDAKADQKSTRLPSMLKPDKEVSVLADKLVYDGIRSLATYTGNALLFQGDTSVKGSTITIDEKSGDLTATGKAMTTTTRDQTGKNNKKERIQSTGTAEEMRYEDAPRRLTYSGNAHLVGPEGDMSATRIELYLQKDGDEVQRAEAYAEGSDKMTLKEAHRTTTGNRMSYDADKETYIVKGLPATVLDECGRETTGTTLTFVKATDTIVVDGNQIRTQTRGGNGKCQS